MLEIGIMEPRAQVMGGVGIFDLAGLSMNHTLHMSPAVAQKMIAIMVVCRKLNVRKINKFYNRKYFLDVTALSNNSHTHRQPRNGL